MEKKVRIHNTIKLSKRMEVIEVLEKYSRIVIIESTDQPVDLEIVDNSTIVNMVRFPTITYTCLMQLNSSKINPFKVVVRSQFLKNTHLIKKTVSFHDIAENECQKLSITVQRMGGTVQEHSGNFMIGKDLNSANSHMYINSNWLNILYQSSQFIDPSKYMLMPKTNMKLMLMEKSSVQLSKSQKQSQMSQSKSENRISDYFPFSNIPKLSNPSILSENTDKSQEILETKGYALSSITDFSQRANEIIDDLTVGYETLHGVMSQASSDIIGSQDPILKFLKNKQ